MVPVRDTQSINQSVNKSNQTKILSTWSEVLKECSRISTVADWFGVNLVTCMLMFHANFCLCLYFSEVAESYKNDFITPLNKHLFNYQTPTEKHGPGDVLTILSPPFTSPPTPTPGRWSVTWISLLTNPLVTSHAVVLRLVTRPSPRTSAQLSDHFRSLAVSQS